MTSITVFTIQMIMYDDDDDCNEYSDEALTNFIQNVANEFPSKSTFV
jgi:hypothetical protein